MLIFNLKITLRNLWKNGVFSAINIIGLAISMACCLVISLYVWNELNYDSFHKHANNIYRVTEKQNQAGVFYNVVVTPGPLAPALQKDFPEIVNTVRFGQWGGTLQIDTARFEESIKLTDNSIFKIFDFPLAKGNPATALSAPDDIVITEKTADKYFGKDWRSNANILGQVIRFNNETDYKLAAIAQNPPENSSIQFDVLMPLSGMFLADAGSFKWNSNSYHTYLQLKPATDINAFSKKITNKLDDYDQPKDDQLLLQPLSKQYLYSDFAFNTDWGKRSNIKYINIFTSVGLLLLLIACINFINLSTARSLKKSMEVGIRKVNGASRKQLVVQFLGESLLIATIAGIIAIIIIITAKPWIAHYTSIVINTSLSQSIILPCFVVFTILIGLVAGLYPSFILSSFQPARVLKKASSIRSGKLFRQGLVVFQFTISVTLITCVFFMYRQLRFVQQKDLGFDKEQLITVSLKGSLMNKADLFQYDLDKLPGIVGTAAATINMVNVDNSSYMEWEGMQPNDKFLISQANVTPNFIPALGMKIVHGENFSFQKTNDTANFILNESAAKRMGYNNATAIGKKVDFWGAKGQIIAVVKDFNFKPLKTGIEPFIFRYQPQDRYFNLFVKIKPGQTHQVLPQIEKIFKKYEPDATFNFSFVKEALNALYEADNRTANIILFFAYLTVLIGCLGLFGLTVFSAEQRTKEIGIRKVLGAGVASITALISRDFLRLVGLAILIAIPAAWYGTTKWLQNYVYRISIEWWVFVLIGISTIGIALFTISLHAIKAATANPVKSIGSE